MQLVKIVPLASVGHIKKQRKAKRGGCVFVRLFHPDTHMLEVLTI